MNKIYIPETDDLGDPPGYGVTVMDEKIKQSVDILTDPVEGEELLGFMAIAVTRDLQGKVIPTITIIGQGDEPLSDERTSISNALFSAFEKVRGVYE